MRVLSLFDGMACGRAALERAGIRVTQYFASEIDKYAITVARKNWPDIVHLGDVRTVREMAEHGLFCNFDLIIGGSPCQGFSFAGKQLAFNDPRSVLFFEYVRILRAVQKHNPNVKFMLENVRMKKEHLETITAYMGVEPVCINSALVSAQNRVRFYWCNWSVSQPKDRGILLRDIVEDGEHPSHVLSKTALNRAANTKYSKPQIMPEKTGTLNTKNNSGQLSFDKVTTLVPVGVIKHNDELKIRNEKAMCLDANYYKGVDNHGQRTMIVHGAAIRRQAGNLEVLKDEKANSLLSDGHQSRLISLDRNYQQGSSGEKRALSNLRSLEEKANCLSASNSRNPSGNGCTNISTDNITYRKLTPVECERLQGLPDSYTEGVSNTQRYKMLGNGWQVDTIEHIFKEMPA